MATSLSRTNMIINVDTYKETFRNIGRNNSVRSNMKENDLNQIAM